MNIFYYQWDENTRLDMTETLRQLGHMVVCNTVMLQNYSYTPECDAVFDPFFRENSFDLIFSFNYFPAVAEYAHRHQVPYVCWVYDCPNLTLYSNTVCYPENYIFIFDRSLCEITRQNGACHVFHLPLAVNTARLEREVSQTGPYRYEVSFVGSLYTGNQFDQIRYLPDYTAGYLNAVMGAQQKVWGYNFISELLTQDMIDDMNQYIKLGLDPAYAFTAKDIYCNMLNAKVTSMDRCLLLSAVARRHSLALFTNSGNIPEELHSRGIVSYTKQMPEVFQFSKINLNISLRSITSGIPLRALDVMGAGGFLLSNYQPELAEFFTAGEEYVFFEDENDLLYKIDYYLSHEEERKAIARRGYEKICNQFTYEKAVAVILQTVFGARTV